MAKKQKKCEEAPKGAPLWMVTYGDLMSLLLTFFVLIVSFSSMQESKFLQALGSLKGALGIMRHMESSFVKPYVAFPKLTSKDKKRLSLMIQSMKMSLQEKELDKKVKMNIKDNGILIRIDAPLLFPSGKADLKSEVIPVLDKIVEMAKGWPNSIRIEGHTDNRPIHSVRFPSNWELSSARAIAVLRYFIKRGVPAGRLAAVGYGEYHPLLPNTTPENMAKNRRVEIYIKYKEYKRKGKDILPEF